MPNCPSDRLIRGGGGSRFGTGALPPLTRERQWELTAELLTAWKAEAVALGVPAEDLDPPPSLMEALPIVDVGIAAQRAEDNRRLS